MTRRLALAASALLTLAARSAAAQSRPDVVTTAEDVYREWTRNEAAARAKYEGRTIQVTGKSPSVHRSTFAGSSSVILRAYYSNVVTCLFDEADKAQLDRVDADRPVTVIGAAAKLGPGGLGLSGCRVADAGTATPEAAPPKPAAPASSPVGEYAVYQGSGAGFAYQYALTLSAGGRYRLGAGGGGSYAYDAATKRLRFASGPLRGFGGYHYLRTEDAAKGEPAIALSASGPVDPQRIDRPGITGYQYAYLRPAGSR